MQKKIVYNRKLRTAVETKFNRQGVELQSASHQLLVLSPAAFCIAIVLLTTRSSTPNREGKKPLKRCSRKTGPISPGSVHGIGRRKTGLVNRWLAGCDGERRMGQRQYPKHASCQRAVADWMLPSMTR